jgi:outer membrane protein OmpA-like peptidoglycan-associated protein
VGDTINKETITVEVPKDSTKPIFVQSSAMASELTYKGNFLEAWQWYDANGKNVLILSTAETSGKLEEVDETANTAELFAKQYVVRPAISKPEILWELYDSQKDCIFDLTAAYISPPVFTDLDQDNVPDRDDLCPDKAGTIANNGCPDLPKPEPVKVIVETPPVISVTEAAVFDEALYGIEFESGSATIRKKSYTILDKIFGIMQERSDLYFEIAGHTDNSGNAKDNRKLSQDRAKSVLSYLVKKGIAANRLSPEGYGESQPLVPNNSTENRAKNRRVQFKIR